MRTDSPDGSRASIPVPESSKGSTAEYLQRWLDGRRALRPSTLTSYRITVDKYLVPHLGGIELFYLLPSDIDTMYTFILNDGSVGPSTVAKIHATLMSALNAAVRAGEIRSNPAALVELPRVLHVRRDTWTAAQLATFLRAIKDDELFALFALLALTGMRRGEALGLRREDVDLVNRRVRIERQVSQVGSRLVVGDPKSSKGFRTVAIDKGLGDALKAHLRTTSRAMGREPSPSDWVFDDGHGAPLRPADVTRRFRQLEIAAGVPSIRLHDLRHTSATLGLESGETLLEVSRRLGHSSLAITGDIYSDVSPEMARNAADRMAAHIWHT